MPKYLFNIEATVEVEADTEDDALQAFWVQTEQTQYLGDAIKSVRVIDNDVMLVEVN